MGLEDFLIPVTRTFSGIKTKAYRWKNESLVDKIKNAWHNAKYYTRNFYEKSKSGIKWLENGILYIAESRVIGALPEIVTRKYVNNLGIRWKNRPTVLSAIQGLVFDNPFQIATGIALLGTPLAPLGWFQLVNGVYGMGESAVRLGYTLHTGKNMGIAAYALPAKLGMWTYKKLKKSQKLSVPYYKTNTYSNNSFSKYYSPQTSFA